MSRGLKAKTYSRIPDVYNLPTLIEVQLDSFKWFISDGLRDLFDEISPIESFNGSLSLHFPSGKPESQQFRLGYRFEEPKYSQKECLERDLTYAKPLHVKVVLLNRETGENLESEIFMGDLPWMTENGTFIINGTERVVVSQLIRSPGVYFDADEDAATGRLLAQAKLIPDRGAWMEFETRKSDYLTIKFNRKRTIPVTILLRAMAAVDDGLKNAPPILTTGSDEELMALFAGVDTNPDHRYIEATIRQEPDWAGKDNRTVAEEAL